MQRQLLFLAALAVLVGARGTAVAGPIVLDQWYEFSFTEAGVFARGCLPADPLGLLCTPSPSGNSVFADAPPWTGVVAPGTQVLFTVTDAFVRGEAFDVFDNGFFIGSTPPVPADGLFISADPQVAVFDPRISHASFVLNPGSHSLTILPSATPYGPGAYAAYFVANLLTGAPIPEPATFALLGLGALGLLGYARAWRRAA